MKELIGWRIPKDLKVAVEERAVGIFKATGKRVTKQKIMEAILRANINNEVTGKEHELTCRFCSNHIETVVPTFKLKRVVCTACENVNHFLNSDFQN